MNCKKVALGALILFALFFGTVVTTGMAFSQAPTHTDPGGDSLPECTDILKVWVDNDAIFLRFKLELNGSIDQSLCPIYDIFISIDNSTGMDAGWDLPVDYRIYFEITATGLLVSGLQESGNSSNDHGNPIQAGLMYYSLSNNNCTLELGYKIQTADQGTGYLNVSIGQTIYLKFEGGLDSDFVPDGNLFIRYVLTEAAGGIPGFQLPFLSLTVLLVIAFSLLGKRRITL
jgi:hypothetical protein